ncbi:MAG: tetratricopeptide repeat protein [Balneolaceae bacterium]|nr:tetratricopeptide repeat protein [Balneolaceae bacterium]
MKLFKSIFLTALIAMASTVAFAQEEADAINAYNEAQELAQSKDFDAAINKFGEAIELGEAVGNADIVTRSKNYIPKLFYQKAAAAFQAFRSSPSVSGLDNVIALFEESQSMGTEYGDSDISNRSRGVLAQLHFQKGTMLYKQENFEAADASFDKALQINSNYAKAYYQKGLVAKKMGGEVETIMSWFDRAINIGNQVNDNTVVRQANNAAHAELLFRGSKAIENNRLTNAIELLQSSLTYNAESSDSFYRLAEASNKLGNYNDAIEYATTAIEHEQGGATDKAKIYFEIGFAQQSKGNKAQACEAFTNASYGSFRAPSEHKMEFELKCESTN